MFFLFPFRLKSKMSENDVEMQVDAEPGTIQQIFCNLRVTSTGFANRKEVDEVQKAITNNGGLYFPDYQSSNINLVIVKRNSEERPKLTKALNVRKDCVYIEWMHDSIEKGYALPFEAYRLFDKEPNSNSGNLLYFNLKK